MIHIEKVQTEKQIAEFVNIGFQINRNNPLWIPGLIKQDIELLTPGRHPFWESAERALFIARSENMALGRIAAIVDRKYNDYAKVSCGAFGFFECVNDYETAHGLLTAAKEWLSERGMTFMRGPLNPSTNYTCGLLVSGFDYPPSIMMPWNPPYYAELLEGWYMHKEQDLFAYTIEREDMFKLNFSSSEIDRLKRDDMFSFRHSTKATLKQDIAALLDIYKIAWADNWCYSPLSSGEAEYQIKELHKITDLELFALFFHKNKPVAGMLALPDLNPLLKSLNGKIGLSAPWHFWKNRHAIRRSCRIILFGVLPEYRMYGLPLLLFDYMMDKARSRPEMDWIEGSWTLEDNVAINDLIEDFNGKITKRYRIYRREICPC